MPQMGAQPEASPPRPGPGGSPPGPGHAEEVEQPGGPTGNGEPLAWPCSSSPSSESMPTSSAEAAADLRLSAQPQVEAPSPQALGLASAASSPSCGPRRAVTLGALVVLPPPPLLDCASLASVPPAALVRRASRVRLPMSLPQAPRLPTVGSKPMTAVVSAFNVSCDFEFE